MNDEIQSLLGARLRHFRTEKKYSIEGLAHKADMNTAQLGKIERGERNFTFKTLDRILKALEVDYPEFFALEEEAEKAGDPLTVKAIENMKSMTVKEQEQFYRTTSALAEKEK